MVDARQSGREHPAAIQALTGISNEMVAPRRRFERDRARSARAHRGRLLVAHNARFDYGFLRTSSGVPGTAGSRRVLCTVKLSRRLDPELPRHNLDTLIARHGFAARRGTARWATRGCCGNSRSSGARIRAEAVARSDGEAAENRTTVPPGCPTTPSTHPGRARRLPFLRRATSAVRGQKHQPAHAGDVAFLRRPPRQQGHEASPRSERIDWIETRRRAGRADRGSAAREKARAGAQPPAAARTELCAWHWPRRRCGRAPLLVSARDLDIGEFGDLYGLFRSRRAAIEALREMAAEHQLCHGLLGLEKASGPLLRAPDPALPRRLRRREAAEAHALRLAAALAKLRMRAVAVPRPYRRPRNRRRRERANCIVLDQWCYLGTVRSEEELRELQENRAAPAVRPRHLQDPDPLPAQKTPAANRSAARRDCGIIIPATTKP
jgi:DNA polymerase III subunit epsilon